MKLSNETKIGVMAIVGVALLVIGFSYLKGHGIFKKEKRIYAVYGDVQGLQQSNPVVINGLQIGRIESLDGVRAGKVGIERGAADRRRILQQPKCRP